MAASKPAATKPRLQIPDKSDELTIFFTGNELGALKPCGCFGGQLGGLDRRSVVFDTAPATKRLIIDIGSLVEADSEQNLIKFNIILQAFGLLEYNLVNLTEKDVEIAANMGLLDSINTLVSTITPHSPADVNLPAVFTKKLTLKEKPIEVTVATFDAITSEINQINELFTDNQSCSKSQNTSHDTQTSNVNILILNQCEADTIAAVEKLGIVDCLICPSDSDEAGVLSDPNAKPLVFSVGRYGKYISRLRIKPASKKAKPLLSFSSIPVTEDLPQQASLVELYEVYQQLVKEANLLAEQPRFSLENGLEYVNSKSCKPCHEYEYEQWSTKPHANAYATLENVGSQYDPECIACHVVGFEYETGFVSELQTPELKNVGCENCHGPGFQHIKTCGSAKTSGPMTDCTDCHTPDHSGEYAANELLYFEKITHWREPNSNSNVKKNE